MYKNYETLIELLKNVLVVYQVVSVNMLLLLLRKDVILGIFSARNFICNSVPQCFFFFSCTTVSLCNQVCCYVLCQCHDLQITIFKVVSILFKVIVFYIIKVI